MALFSGKSWRFQTDTRATRLPAQSTTLFNDLIHGMDSSLLGGIGSAAATYRLYHSHRCGSAKITRKVLPPPGRGS
jgi:hypothetical protein